MLFKALLVGAMLSVLSGCATLVTEFDECLEFPSAVHEDGGSCDGEDWQW